MGVLPEAAAGHQRMPLSASPHAPWCNQGLGYCCCCSDCLRFGCLHRLGESKEPVMADFTAFYAAGYSSSAKRTGSTRERPSPRRRRPCCPTCSEARGYYNPRCSRCSYRRLAGFPYPAAAALWTAFSLVFLFCPRVYWDVVASRRPALLAVGTISGVRCLKARSPLVVAV